MNTNKQVDRMFNRASKRRTSKPMYGGLLILGTVITCFAAWLTHVITTLLAKQFVLLVAGAIMFPIAIIHGIGIWLGVF